VLITNLCGLGANVVNELMTGKTCRCHIGTIDALPARECNDRVLSTLPAELQKLKLWPAPPTENSPYLKHSVSGLAAILRKISAPTPDGHRHCERSILKWRVESVLGTVEVLPPAHVEHFKSLESIW
jgi:hypothetical protein